MALFFPAGPILSFVANVSLLWSNGPLGVNLVGDALNALFSHDPRAAMGVPIAGAPIFYLLTAPVRRFFAVE